MNLKAISDGNFAGFQQSKNRNSRYRVRIQFTWLKRLPSLQKKQAGPLLTHRRVQKGISNRKRRLTLSAVQRLNEIIPSLQISGP